MLEQLTAYYRAHGIAAESFACPFAADCSRGAVDFVEAREPFVGTDYEKGTLPRLLFISLDPANAVVGRSAKERTVSAVREWEAGQLRPESGHPLFQKQSHWYRTYQLAQRLLSPVAAVRGMGPLPFSEMSRYFAHTNSAKCKNVAGGTGQGPERLFKNCRGFLPGEVEVLIPDIIVAQGKPARLALAGAFKVLLSGAAPDPLYRAEVVELGSRPVLKFETHHPNRKDNSFRLEAANGWPWYSEVASVFAAGGPEALAAQLGFCD